MADSTTASDARGMELVERALAQPEAEREAFVRMACGVDDALFEAVWGRVRSEQMMKDFLLTPLFPRDTLPEPFAPGQVLGSRFRLTREVGHGGLGVGYEGIDEQRQRGVGADGARARERRRLTAEE